MTRALIYCRISSDPTGRAAGVDRQEKECRDLAERLGWDVHGVLIDNDISAHSGKRRPAYEQLLDEIRAGRCDAFVAWHADRLYRRSRDLQELIDIVNQHRIEIRTVTSGDIDLTTATGRAVAKTVAVWNEHEVEHAIERMKLAKDEAATAGLWRGGPRPFGYEADGMTIREDEAKLVRDATRRILQGGTLNAIAVDWNSRGILTSRGGPWVPVVVRRLLMRARNAARIERYGENVAAATWPPIVPEHEWQAVRHLLGDQRRSTTSTRDRRWLGSGLYRCGICADGTTVRIASGGGSARPKRSTYRCRSDQHLIRTADLIDAYVTDVVADLLESRLTEGLRVAPPGDEDQVALQAEATAIRTELDAARAAYGRRELDLTSFTVAAKQMQADLDSVEVRLSGHVSRSPLAALLADPDPVGLWCSDRLPLDQRRAVVGALVVVTLLHVGPGRKAGGGYFDASSVVIERRGAGS